MMNDMEPSLPPRPDTEQTARPTGPHKPSIPANTRVYAIGDIHGRLDLLTQLNRLIAADMATAPGRDMVVIFLGDTIDRGPDSRSILETLSGLATSPSRVRETFQHDASVLCLRGNHEQILLDFMADPSRGPVWLTYGGRKTLASYGIASQRNGIDRPHTELSQALIAAIPDHHVAFLKALKTFVVLGGYMFVHAGIRPGIPLKDQILDDLIFIREPFLSWPDPHPYVVVHGHQIVEAPEFRANRIDIDTGAYASGHLTCLVLDGTEQKILST